MKTEISFLLDLILDEELNPKVQKLCRKRIRELETTVVTKPVTPIKVNTGVQQAPSTQRLLDEMAAQTGAQVPYGQLDNPIAQTAQAAAALASRQSAINAAMSNKPEIGRTSPRKF